jgi:hypothetical protein
VQLLNKITYLFLSILDKKLGKKWYQARAIFSPAHEIFSRRDLLYPEHG